MVERVRAAVCVSPIAAGDVSIPVTCSIGVATLDLQAPTDPLVLVGAADRALYQAKHAGRNRAVAAGPHANVREPQ